MAHESGVVQVFGRRDDDLTTDCGGGGRKAPRHEVAGSWAPVVQRALWGFDGGADLDVGCDADRTRRGDLHTGGIGSVEQASRQAL
jgi:hypothetical protein